MFTEAAQLNGLTAKGCCNQGRRVGWNPGAAAPPKKFKKKRRESSSFRV